VAFNSQGFHLVTERTRQKLDDSVIKEIYNPLDAGGMPFIDLKHADVASVKAFHEATAEAFNEWRDENSVPFPEWQQLIRQLEADPRLASDV